MTHDAGEHLSRAALPRERTGAGRICLEGISGYIDIQYSTNHQTYENHTKP